MPVFLGKPQTKYIRFCLNLDKITQISFKEFKTLNWLLVGSRFNKSVNVMVYKGVNSMFLSYLYKVFKLLPTLVLTLEKLFRDSKQCLAKQLLGKTYSHRLSFLRSHSRFKKFANTNTFKNNLKKCCFLERTNLNK